jgi:hypothetical protein
MGASIDKLRHAATEMRIAILETYLDKEAAEARELGRAGGS